MTFKTYDYLILRKKQVISNETNNYTPYRNILHS